MSLSVGESVYTGKGKILLILPKREKNIAYFINLIFFHYHTVTGKRYVR